MNKNCERILACIAAVALVFSAAGCSDTKKSQKDSLVYLDYGIGQDEKGRYDKELFGLNGVSDVESADPGAFYVSEEEDPVWGGYYYMYPTGFISVSQYYSEKLEKNYWQENHVKTLGTSCYRSKDLYSWEKCGAVEGYACVIDTEDWCDDFIWAPEVIRNPADGKYYLYFTCSCSQNYGVAGMSTDTTGMNRMYIAVAVSDTPVGPFDVCYDTDPETGKRVPTINFQTAFQLDKPWSVIDVSPFFDEDGEFYLYFRKHGDYGYAGTDGLWGVKMKSMTHPDYSTMSCLAVPGKLTASNTSGNITEVTSSGEDEVKGINEGPYMYKHNGKYYLTYSVNGYDDVAYSVCQAVSDDPLKGFEKVSFTDGNPVLNGSYFGYMNGTGHHAFVKNQDELWIVYHRHDGVNGFKSGYDRSICADRVSIVTNAQGLEVLTANGPSKVLQWLPENVSGRKNLAETASVEIDNGTGAQYLTDTVLPFYSVAEQNVMTVEEGDVTVTLKWEEPVSISSLMIYNSRDVEQAFSKISDVRFKLAEKPEWAKKDYDYAVIKDLKIADAYYDKDSGDYIACAPAVAVFDTIKVTEIQFTIEEGDRLAKFNKQGKENKALKLSEIVVLGGVE